MTYGSLGGLGGRASSFPMRSGTAPTSQTVGYQQSWADWEADWQKRLAGLPISPATPLQNQMYPYLEDPSRPLAPTPENMWVFSGQSAPGTPQSYAETGQGSASWGGPLAWGGGADRPLVPTAENIHLFPQTEGTSPASIDEMRKNLMREREVALETWQPQIRQQQAYDSMRGWGQENAVMGPNYQQANFGQITGDPTGGMGASPLSGVNGTQSGVYSAGGAQSGVYGAPRRSNWGL